MCAQRIHQSVVIARHPEQHNNSVVTERPSSHTTTMAAMIRQRKADQAIGVSPSSRGGSSTGYRSDSEREMTQIIIEEESADETMMDHHFESYYTPRPPVMIPDKRYKDFMLGRTSKIKQTSMLPDGPTCARTCIGFSWVAVFFLVSRKQTVLVFCFCC